MLKKYSDFISPKTTHNKDVCSSTCDQNIREEKKVKDKPKISKNIRPEDPDKDLKKKVIKEPVLREPTEPKNENVITNNFVFNGKIVQFSSDIKPSESIKLLKNNNISEEKLHYLISKQTPDTLVVLKYNEKADKKLSEFMNTLIDYYKNNLKSDIFDNIIVEGNESYSIIKNINNDELLKSINTDIINLLK